MWESYSYNHLYRRLREAWVANVTDNWTNSLQINSGTTFPTTPLLILSASTRHTNVTVHQNQNPPIPIPLPLLFSFSFSFFFSFTSTSTTTITQWEKRKKLKYPNPDIQITAKENSTSKKIKNLWCKWINENGEICGNENWNVQSDPGID